jgi:ribosomal protein S12 methylthiotransferase
MLPVIRNNETNQNKENGGEKAPKKKKREDGKAPNFTISSNKVFFISLGCPRNLVDTEVMLGILLQAGYEPCQEIESADFIIINTCGFLESSRQESIDTIRASLTNKKEGAKVIATGCMVQTHSDVIKKECPDVHYLLGSGDVGGILKACESQAAGNEITEAKSYLEVGEVPRTISTPKHYAYLKIAEGCRKRCSFCIIPTIKGQLKSKSEEQILKELNVLLNQGVQEIILIAQDLGDYGKDHGYKRSDGLVKLLTSILEKEKRHFWLRLLYLYPDEITDELIQLMKSDPRICHYLDMPIQHINNDLLKSMRRLTSKEDILSIITKLRKEMPNIVIRTSLIVGFPGETEEQFQELEEFVKKYPLDNIGIFKYSNEEKSHAATLPNHISEEVKQERLERLVKLQQKNVEKLNKKLIDKSLEVVVEGFHPETKLLVRGRYYGQCPEIDGEIIINEFSKVKEFGKRYMVKITELAGYDLVGHVVGQTPNSKR